MIAKIYTIYRATNIVNGKVYIGFDSNWPKRRDEHIWAALRGDSSVFYNAIRKYNENNFIWDIIYQSHDAEHTKNVMEEFFIREYNSCIHFMCSNGYNMTIGGEGTLGYTHSQETKDKIAEWNLDKIVSQKTRNKISDSKKGKTMRHSGSFQPGHIPWSKGKIMPAEYSAICSAAQQKRFQDKHELEKLAKAREKGKKSLQEKAKIEITFPDNSVRIMTPAEFANEYRFNLRTVYWNLKKHKGEKIVAGVLAGYTLSQQS